MPLTIDIEGKGVIANCDVLTDDTGGTGTGDWTEQGGGTMSLSEDVFLVGSSCVGGKYAGKSGFQQFDLGINNELDFTASTGSEAGEFLYIWVAMTALGTLDVLSTYPLCVRLSSDSPGTSNYIDYLIAGSDDKNGWSGGFKLFVIDPTLTPSRISGTQSAIIASVRTLGIWIDCSGSARADSIFIDQMAVGSGLRITGTSTTGWSDTVNYCTDYANRGWGMFQEREGIYYSYGKTYIGDAASQSAAVSFADSGKIIQYGLSQYYESAAWKSSYGVDACGIVIEDHASYTTTFTDGVIVGADKGRSGSVIVGNADQNVSLNLYGGNNGSSVTALYGTTLKDITGTINSGDDTGHEFLGVSIAGCEQFDPVGAPVIKNCVFAETVNTDSALLWNDSIDITDCSFIANTTGAGIEHNSQTGIDSGSATETDGTGVTLTDSLASFSGNVAVNDIVYNEDTDGYGTVTDVTDNTHLDCSAGLSSGGWTSGDVYSIDTPITYTNLLFSGNTTDIANTTAPANVVAISKAGTSDPITESGFTVIQGSVVVKVTVSDAVGDPIENAQTSVWLSSNDSPILNDDTSPSGVLQGSFPGATPADCYIRVRKSSTGDTKYIPFSATGTIQSSTGLNLAVTLTVDTNA